MDGILGIDFGGTSLKSCLATGSQLKLYDAIPTPKDMAALRKSLMEVSKLANDDLHTSVAGVGIGLPGLVGQDGEALFLPHLKDFSSLNFVQLVEDIVGAPARLDNDANCAGVAELREIGACASGYEVVIGIGTGLGAAIFGPSGIARGFSGFSGEVGHICIERNGRSCECGRRGCWEQYCSGGSIRSELDSAGWVDINIEEVFREMDVNPDFKSLVEEFCFHLGLGIANLVAILDLERVVLTGGLARSLEAVLPKVRRYYLELVEGAGARRETEIRVGSLFEFAGAIGATYLWNLVDG